MPASASLDPTVNRRLAAIAFADVAAYSKLMEVDDVGTMARWKVMRSELLEPKLTEHRGRLIRVVGDGLFIEFRSVVDAVRWAQDVQQVIAESVRSDRDNAYLPMRIGINVEDVIVDEDDLHGDGVNIAARVQQLANPGEVIVTATVHDYVLNKLGVSWTDIGERELKNISRQVRLYRMEVDSEGKTLGVATHSMDAWSRRPSIAVLPFRNMSGDPGENYFGEGITEDIHRAIANAVTVRHRQKFDVALS